MYRVCNILAMALLPIVLIISSSVAQELGRSTTMDNDSRMWERLGPQGGTVQSIVISPNDHNTLYSVAWGNPSQIYRTENGGEVWGIFTEPRGRRSLA